MHPSGLSARGTRELALLLIGLACVLFFRLGAAPAANPAEGRVEAVVRDMAGGGDWLVPRMNGEPRLQKPPGYYWAAAAVAWLGGEAGWTAVRAPSALAALALVVAVFAWGRRIGGPELGCLAALCLATMQFTLIWGRRGVAEMPLALFGTLALASFSRIRLDGDGAGRELGWFALWIALAILAKATVALLIVGLPIGLWLWLDAPAGRSAARPVLTWAALGTGIGFLWYGVVLAVQPGASGVLLSEALLPIGVRTAGPRSALHYASPLYYVGPLLVGAAPVVVFLPLMVRRWRESRLYAAEPRKRFVALALLSLLIAFMLIPQKRRHYLLPLAPLVALLAAEAILELRDRAPERLRRGLLQLARGVLPIGLGGLVLIALFRREVMGAPLVQSLALLGVGTALLAGSLRTLQRGQLRGFAAFCAVGVLSLGLVWLGSVDVWRRRLESGAEVECGNAPQPCWRSVREAHPVLARIFRVRGPES